MLLKHGVRLLGAKPELIIGLMVADTIYASHGFKMVVTSIVDSTHSKTSRHYLGLAADLRTNDLPSKEVKVVYEELKQMLPEFYILLEGEGSPNEHLHMQFNGSPP